MEVPPVSDVSQATTPAAKSASPGWAARASRFAELISLNDIPYWIAALITGLIAVGYAETFRGAESLSKQLMKSSPYVILGVGPLCFLVAWALVHFIAPNARGSGIPQVMSAVDASSQAKGRRQFLTELLGLKTMVVKVLSSLICVVGGGAVGREGPTIQIAAGIFNIIGRKFERFLPNRLNHEFWLVTGGAAGIAAAFNTPLGGLVYGIEELATAHVNRFKTSLIAAVIIAGMASQWIAGSYLYLGYPRLTSISPAIVPWALLVGAVSGLWGAFFGKMLYLLAEKRRKLKKPLILAGIALMCGFLISAAAVFWTPSASGPGREVLLHLLFKDIQGGDWELVVARFLAPMISYLSGCAGGIFAPSLAAGGAVGALLANLVNTPYPNLFVLLGMIGFLTGVTRAPFTSFVLVLEMTDRHSAIFPMMLAAVVSVGASRLVDGKSFYERVKEEFSPDLKTTH